MSKFVRMTLAGQTWLVRKGCESLFTAGWRSLGVVKLGTNKAMERWQLNGAVAFVKSFRKRSIFSPNLARREFKGLVAAADRGVPVLEPMAAHLTVRGGVLVFEDLREFRRLDQVLADTRPRRDLIRAYARFCRLVHDAGVWQDDFNPTNVLYHAGRFVLIDFERAKVKRALSPSERYKMLAGMNRITGFTRSERLLFLRTYLGAGEWKGPAREILRRTIGRLEARRRKLAKKCTSDNRNFGVHRGETVTVYFRKGVLRRSEVEAGRFDGLVEVPAADALEAWREAFRNGRMPVACVIPNRSKAGKLLYRPQ